MSPAFMNYFLVKQEPADYPWAQLVQDRQTAWTGIRNFQARNFLRAMKRGDAVLYYHTGEEKQVVGVCKVVKAAYPDPTAEDGDWSAVDLVPAKPLARPVALAALRADPVLRDMLLLRQTRLSVTALTPEQFARVIELGATRL
jgi:predicted RNA-binding protein with PUA-like domain